MAPTQPKVHTLVVDTGPLFKDPSQIYQLADEFVTVPEVIAEVRDKQSRELVAALPFELKVRIPSEEAIHEVSNFAKKTGDYPSLSIPDIKVLALTWMLEKEAHGTVEHLRKEPVRPTEQRGSRPVMTPSPSLNTDKNSSEPLDGSSDPLPESIQPEESADSTSTTDLSNDLAELEISSPDLPANEPELPPTPTTTTSETRFAASTKSHVIPSLPGFVTPADDEDDDGWITPSNVKKMKSLSVNGVNVNGEKEVVKELKVACLTSDFAMQNVLLQFKLNLISIDGIVIKRLKNWLLRCHACFKTTHDLSKKFCPFCGGGNTLMRTSYSIDANGQVVLYLKRNMQYRVRGTIYSIPKAKGGRESKDLILREDQKEHVKALKNYNHHKKKMESQVDVFDADYVPKMLLGTTSNKGSGGWNDLHAPSYGYGRKNPNERRRKRK
ncbi:Nin one binding Zn-ribbon like-domain-containing protein [Paraphysoderma sedebokerense]|nr:Nin one binding Zn-ribbon like-domain-containing protein [Paraphysoderma sedebokerense]